MSFYRADTFSHTIQISLSIQEAKILLHFTQWSVCYLHVLSLYQRYFCCNWLCKWGVSQSVCRLQSSQNHFLHCKMTGKGEREESGLVTQLKCYLHSLLSLFEWIERTSIKPLFQITEGLWMTNKEHNIGDRLTDCLCTWRLSELSRYLVLYHRSNQSNLMLWSLFEGTYSKDFMFSFIFCPVKELTNAVWFSLQMGKLLLW